MRGQAKRLQEILNDRFGIFVSDCREDYLVRRLERRFSHFKVSNLDEYLPILLKLPDERMRLLERLSVTVTEFFRDPRLYKTIRGKVFPEIARRKIEEGRNTIRVWSAACATGEEPYSLAMELTDFLEKNGLPLNIEITASDINSHSLAFAEKGLYSPERVKDVPEHFLRRFFLPPEKGFRIAPELRGLIEFKNHDLTSKTPVLQHDLIVCRNVLVYLDDDSQREVVDYLSDQLMPGGFLAVGPWINGIDPEIMESFDLETSVYRRLPAPRVPLGSSDPAVEKTLQNIVVIGTTDSGRGTLARILHDAPIDGSTAVVVVPCFPDRFLGLFTASLQCVSANPIGRPVDGEALAGGNIYVAPIDREVRFSRRHDRIVFGLSESARYQPKDRIHTALRSAAGVFGERCIAVLLVNKSSDGALGLRIVRERGGAAFVQDEKSIFRFAHAVDAIRLRPAAYALPAADIAPALAERLRVLA